MFREGRGAIGRVSFGNSGKIMVGVFWEIKKACQDEDDDDDDAEEEENEGVRSLAMFESFFGTPFNSPKW